MSATYRLHGAFRSSAVHRVRIALNLKGLAAERVPVNLMAGEQHGAAFQALNRQGLVPVVETQAGDRLVQSMAIIEYLDEMHPAPPFLPGSAANRARIRALAQVVACDIHPLNNLRVLNRLRALGHDEAAVIAWYHHWLRAGCDALEAMLGAEGAPFCAGAAPTLADICLVPQVYNAEIYKFDLSPYPAVQRVTANCRALDAFTSAAPHNQPEAQQTA
jgi:maleylpyruvate isomerase